MYIKNGDPDRRARSVRLSDKHPCKRHTEPDASSFLCRCWSFLLTACEAGMTAILTLKTKELNFRELESLSSYPKEFLAGKSRKYKTKAESQW